MEVYVSVISDLRHNRHYVYFELNVTAHGKRIAVLNKLPDFDAIYLKPI